LIDSNQDGRLSRKELNEAAFIMGMNPTSREIEEWWSRADIDGQLQQCQFQMLYWSVTAVSILNVILRDNFV
jgi:Ca2+-binding EF-hand superfamily protein